MFDETPNSNSYLNVITYNIQSNNNAHLSLSLAGAFRSRFYMRSGTLRF